MITEEDCVICSVEELDITLCDWCPLENTSMSSMYMCEGSHCDEAYDTYCEEREEEIAPLKISHPEYFI